MLVTPRLYQLSQVRDKGLSNDDDDPDFNALAGWWHNGEEYKQAAKMILVHQTGTVKVGEVVR